MAVLYRVVIVMEMLAVNLFTVNLCASKKYSGARTLTVFLLFTLVLTYFTNGLWSFMGFDRGNASFALIGIVYLIPISFLYEESAGNLLSSLFSAWVYTMLIYCASVRFAYLLPAGDFLLQVLAVQSMLYAVTVFPFFHWIQKTFLFTLHNIPSKSRHILQAVSLFWFISVMVINASLIYRDREILKAASILLLTADAILSYLLLYSMVMSNEEVKSLENIVYRDNLTGLYNRAGLFKDTSAYMESGLAFRLIFIDLNNFKSINDQYGHLTGDRYLIAFAKTTKSLIGNRGTLYRMSGDEFVIVSLAQEYDPLMRRLQNYPHALSGMSIPFLGCSMGWADYPEEAATQDKLISLADGRMYQNKVTGKELS